MYIGLCQSGIKVYLLFFSYKLRAELRPQTLSGVNLLGCNNFYVNFTAKPIKKTIKNK